jgi:hypothetical protein
MWVFRMLAVGACFCAGAPFVNADPIPIPTADVAADFSATSNPNGVWRYGWSSTLGSPLILSTSPRLRDGVNTWPGDLAADGNPASYHNGTSGVLLVGGGARFEPGQFGMHPGPGGEYAVVRYTAPADGSAALAGAFSGQNIGTSSDVHVLLNGVSLFDAFVTDNGPGSVHQFTRMLMLNTGDTIDFAVGFGRNGTFFGDSTALAAVIGSGAEPPPGVTPEPGTLTLLALGLVGITGRRKRVAAPLSMR